jgi:hypothetical protein
MRSWTDSRHTLWQRQVVFYHRQAKLICFFSAGTRLDLASARAPNLKQNRRSQCFLALAVFRAVAQLWIARLQASACENSMKKCSYCGAEYPDDLVACPIDQTPFEKDYQPIVETESKRRPVIDEKRKRTQELRRIGFQRLLAGIVIFCSGRFLFPLCHVFRR